MSCFEIKSIFVFLLLALTTAIYISSIAPCVYPGTSAACIAKVVGLLPTVPVIQPLWLACSKIAALIPVGASFMRLNCFSMLCGVLSTYLVFKISSRVIFELLEDKNDIVLSFINEKINNSIYAGDNPEYFDKAHYVTAILGGFVSALSFAFSTPLWIASTAHNIPVFNTLLLLIIMSCALKFIYEGSLKYCITSVFLCGIAVVESGELSILVVVIISLLFIHSVRSTLFSYSFVVLFLVTFVCGVMFNIATLFSLQFIEQMFTPANVIPTLANLAKSHLHDIRIALPRLGWPVIILQTFLLFWIAQKGLKSFFGYQSETSKWKWGIVFLLMTLVCSYLIFNLPGSAWSLAKHGSYLPIFPYLGSSLALGAVFSYWLLLAFAKRTNENNDIALSHYSVRILSIATCCFISGTAFISIFRNHTDCNGKSAIFVDNTVKLLLEEIKGKEVLLTDGVLDMNLHIMKQLNQRKLSVMRIPPRHRHVNLDQKRSKSAPFSLISTRAVQNIKPNAEQVFTQWMLDNRHSSDKIASVAHPQIWRNAGIAAVPQGMVYIAAGSIVDQEAYALVANHNLELNKVFTVLNSCKPTRPALKEAHLEIINHLSRVTNDLGVYLENAGDIQRAGVAYEKALDINSDNLSALLNIYGVVVRAGRDSEFQKIDNLIKTKISKLNFYDSFTKKVMQSGSLKHQETDRIFSAVLNKAGGNSTDLAEKIQFLSHWRDHYYRPAPATPESMGLERPPAQKSPNIYLSSAIESVLEGKSEKALSLLDHYLGKNPQDFSAWALLAEIHLNNHDFEYVERYIIPAMKKRMTVENAVFVDMTLGCYYKRKPNPDYAQARGAFLKALNSPHKLSATFEELLDTDKKIGSAVYLKEDAQRILEISPSNSQAHAILGSYNLSLNKLKPAETHLQKSIDSKPSSEAYNDLAMVYLLQKKFEDAEQYARASIRIAPYTYHAWDTLSNICIARNQMDEAEKAINCAIILSPEEIQPYFTLTQIYLKQQNKPRAEEVLQKIKPMLKYENEKINQRYNELYRDLENS